MNRLKVVDLKRFIFRDDSTIGHMRVIYDDSALFECFLLEQMDLSNAPYESCIPVGLYKLKLGHFNAGGYKAYEVQDVPIRTLIKMHVGNTVKNIWGCLCPGDAIHIFSSGMWGVLNSESTFNKFMDVMEGDKESWLSVREER